MRILVCQSDNIGDVLATLPLTKILKKNNADAEIFFLARKYTQPVIDVCDAVDHFIDWEELKAKTDDEIIDLFKSLNLDVIFHSLRVKRIAKCAYKARIPLRVGRLKGLFPLSQWFFYYNKLVYYKKSKLHAAQMALQLLRALKIKSDYTLEEIIDLNLLNSASKNPDVVADVLLKEKFNLVIHAGSNGHGREWPLSSFHQLMQLLPQEKFNIILTGSVAENERFGHILMQGLGSNIKSTMGKLTLSELIALLGAADAVLASGTGPLHIAASLGTKTLGLFPKRGDRIGTTRWAPLGKQAEYLLPTQLCDHTDNKPCNCMLGISVESVKDVLQRFFDNA